jgi:hypothetical protein
MCRGVLLLSCLRVTYFGCDDALAALSRPQMVVSIWFAPILTLPWMFLWIPCRLDEEKVQTDSLSRKPFVINSRVR